MMHTNLSLVLLLASCLASMSTAYSMPQPPTGTRKILPRQFGGGGGNNNNNQNNQNQNNGGNGGNGNNGDSLTLDPNNVQDASKSDGQGNEAEAGQADSETDDANFINFCSGKTLTNGEQTTGGSCNGIVMGDIPSQSNMISSIIISPEPGQDIAANTNFDIKVQVSNLVAGSFTNPDNTYYAAPQQLQGGKVVGHTHVTVQDLGSSTPQQPPDPSKFVFFKGINDAGDGNGLLSTTADGLPPGSYRVCTMTSASNHQPVLMPVAQRGAQDDCTKFTVGKGGGGNAGGDNGGNNGGNNGGDNGGNNGGDNGDNGGDNGGNNGGNNNNGTSFAGNGGQNGGNQNGDFNGGNNNFDNSNGGAGFNNGDGANGNDQTANNGRRGAGGRGGRSGFGFRPRR